MTDDSQAPNKLQLHEIHQLRGEFLSEMVAIEERLNHLALIYFRIVPEQRRSFTAWVLTTMKSSDKIDLLVKMIQADKRGHTFKPFISAMRNLNNLRNDIAHGSVAFNISPGQSVDDAIENWQWASTRWTRSGPQTNVLDTDGLKKQVRRAQYVSAFLVTLMDEMAKAPGRLVAEDLDWRAVRSASLDDRGIPKVSRELFEYITEGAAIPKSR